MVLGLDWLDYFSLYSTFELELSTMQALAASISFQHSLWVGQLALDE